MNSLSSARGHPHAQPERARLAVADQPKRPLLALALQGGGSFGAFTWGVLDRLLREETFDFDIVSGASAGAINAVVLANGLAEGGPREAREQLDRFWKRVSDAGAATPFGLGHAASASLALGIATHIVSPYQFNPLGLDPLRDILRDEIDFERLRAQSPVRLIISATRVRDGRARLFRNAEISLEAVLASACLPHLHHAVIIEGEAYWDGGYGANPPLRELVIDSQADDVVLVQLTPEERDDVPHTAPDIARRVSEIAFNGALQRELDRLEDLVASARERGPAGSTLDRKLQRLRLHRIAAEHAVEGLDAESILNVDRSFLLRLKRSGNDAAGKWLACAENASATASAAKF